MQHNFGFSNEFQKANRQPSNPFQSAQPPAPAFSGTFMAPTASAFRSAFPPPTQGQQPLTASAPFAAHNHSLDSSFTQREKEKKQPRRKEKNDKKAGEKTRKENNNNNKNNNDNNNNNNNNNNNTNNNANTNRSKPAAKSNRRKPLILPRFMPKPYAHRARPFSNDQAVLKALPAPITKFTPRRNSWDVDNQAAMQQIEGDYLNGKQSLQGAFDAMNSMRTHERTKMEQLGLVDSAEVRKNLNEATVFVGSCVQMCPVFERIRRSLENNVFQIEKSDGGKISREKAVKAFNRPAAGNPPPLPSDVRPPSVLVKTLQYLVAEVVPQLPASHPFLWDRTRAIRQDFTFQNYQGPEALWCLEGIARVHCMCLHVMAAAAASGQCEWSQQQELEQLNKCLQSLMDFYGAVEGGFSSESAAEMRAYQLISHLGDRELASSTAQLPICDHPLVELAMELRTLSAQSTPAFFIRLRQPDVPPLLRCLAEVHFNLLRRDYLRLLHQSLLQKANHYALKRFVKLLGFNGEEEARSFCKHYGIAIVFDADLQENVLDFKTYNESTIRSAQPLGQAFDPSLSVMSPGIQLLIGQPAAALVPVTAGSSSSSSSSNDPAKPAGDSALRHELLQQKLAQKREALEQQRQRILEMQQQQQLKEDEKRRLEQQQQLEEQRKQQEIQQQQQQQQLEEQRLREQAEARKREEQERKAREIAAEQRRRELQQQQEEQQRQRQLLQIRQQREREYADARRAARAEFVSAVAQRVLDSVLNRSVSTASRMLVKSLELQNEFRCRQAFVILRNAYSDIASAKKRRSELQSFAEFKRRRLLSVPRAAERVISESSSYPLSTKPTAENLNEISGEVKEGSAGETQQQQQQQQRLEYTGAQDKMDVEEGERCTLEHHNKAEDTGADNMASWVLGNESLMSKLLSMPFLRSVGVNIDYYTSKEAHMLLRNALKLPLTIKLPDGTTLWVHYGADKVEITELGSGDMPQAFLRALESAVDECNYTEEQFDTSRVFSHEHPLPKPEEQQQLHVEAGGDDGGSSVDGEAEQSHFEDMFGSRNWLMDILATADDFM